MLLQIATYGGAKVMGTASTDWRWANELDLVVVPGDTPTEAVMTQLTRTFVIQNGVSVAADGNVLDLND